MALLDRAAKIDEAFRRALSSHAPGPTVADEDSPLRPGASLTRGRGREIFESMVTSRHLDFAARELRRRDEGFYTIGSSGHEANAAVAAATRQGDTAFLHYRSGGFFVERARQAGGLDPIRDVLLGVAASAEEPIAGGRHKVFGSVELNIPPQTSTIGSHLPKAVGAAIAFDRRARLGLPLELPEDSIVLCSFGDASLNHSTTIGSLNAACWCASRTIPVPVLFICEDNGLGISVSTPRGWVASVASRPGLRYIPASGLDASETYEAARQAADWVRRYRRPAFLHLEMVRLLGHAGSDVEQIYRTPQQIAEAEARDPLLRTASALIDGGCYTPTEALEVYEKIGEKVMAVAEEVISRPRLTSAAAVMAPLRKPSASDVEDEVRRQPSQAARREFWGDRLPEEDPKARHLAVTLNKTLGDILVKYDGALVFGEDVAVKGGVYHVTAGLRERAGTSRVFDTLLDEQAILGLAIGAGQMGSLPIPEIQYLAYLHNAADQIRGEAASLSFFSSGQLKNPMVVRIASFAYQKGFGGHFHNDNSIAALRDIPGIVIAAPSRPEDAMAMLRTATAAASTAGAVVLFLEPIARYMTKDLYEPGDGLWTCRYLPPGHVDEPHAPIGRGRTHGDGGDLTIISFANGLYMSLRVAEKLRRERGIQSRVLDLRWLAPLPEADILREARATGRVLVVDETRRSGAVSDAILALFAEQGLSLVLRRVTSRDSFIPLGEAANLVLVGEAEIESAAIELMSSK